MKVEVVVLGSPSLTVCTEIKAQTGSANAMRDRISKLNGVGLDLRVLRVENSSSKSRWVSSTSLFLFSFFPTN